MTRSAFAATLLFFASLFAPASYAQTTSTPSTPQPPVAVTKVIENNTKILDKDGNQIFYVLGGKATIVYDGKLKDHPELPNTKVLDGTLNEWSVRSQGGATSVSSKGPMKGTCEKSSVTINSDGDGQKITVSGDNCKVNCSGTNTSVTVTSTAQGTGISTTAGSSGSVANSGVATSISVGAGSGGWSMGPKG